MHNYLRMNTNYDSRQARLFKWLKASLRCLGLLFLALTGGADAFPQSAVNAGGGGGSLAGRTFDFSIGEMTRIQTAAGTNLIVTEGLLQPSAEEGSEIARQPLSIDALRVYPNPAADILNLQPRLQQGGILHCRLTDLQGRLLLQKRFELSNGNEKQQINVSGLAAGNYLLQATVSQGSAQYTNSFKIQKLR